MAQPLTRPLFDNRLLRATGGPDLGVSLGTSLRATFETPTLGDLVSTQNEIARAGVLPKSEELLQMQERRAEVEALSRDYWDLSPGPERDALQARIEKLSSEMDAAPSSIVDTALEDGRLTSAEDLQEKYADLGLQFDRPMTSGEAEILADGKRAEIIRQSLIERGPRGALPGVAKFGAGLAAMAVDPVEIATAFIPVVGQAGKAAAIARFGKVGGRAAVGAVEGAVGNALTEPFYASLSRSQQLDYTMSDSLLNIGLGLVFGGALGGVAGVLGRSEAAKAPKTSKADLKLGTRLPEGVLPGFEGIDVQNARATAQVALSQFVNGQKLDVSILKSSPPPRPQTLSEFIAARGGVNDLDPVFRGELEQVGVPRAAVRGGVNNPRSANSLDDMAELAQEAGFISDRDPDALVAAIANERRGEFAFAQRDLDDAQAWRDWHQARTDVEAEAARQEGIRKDLDELGIKNVSDVEVSRVSEIMAEGHDLDTAFERMAIQAEEARAEYLAKQAADPRSDADADFEASEEMEVAPSETFVDDDIQEFSNIIQQIERTTGLTDKEAEILAGLDELDDHARVYGETAEAYALCLRRTA